MDNFWFTPFKSTFQAEILQINIGYSWSRGIYSEPKKIGLKVAMVANSGALKVDLLKSLFTYSFYFINFGHNFAPSNLHLTLIKLGKVTAQSYCHRPIITTTTTTKKP